MSGWTIICYMPCLKCACPQGYLVIVTAKGEQLRYITHIHTNSKWQAKVWR